MFLPASSASIEGDRRREEIARQHRIIAAELWPRNVMAIITFGICGLIITPGIAALLMIVNVVSDVLGTRLLAGLDPATDRARYLVVIGAVITMEASLTGAAGLVWLVDDPLAKAFAVGIVMATLLHLCLIRSIHLPLAATGMATVGIVGSGFNLLSWTGPDDWARFALSMVAAWVGLAYSVVAMLSNHTLHRTSADAAAAARASDEAKGRFLTQISHELRTPLNAVIGLAEIEAASAFGASRQRLRTVVTSARDLAVLLDDALDFSALADGRLSITPRPAEVRLDLFALVQMFEIQSRAQGREICLAIGDEVPPTLLIDGQRLRQCLTNLIGNALKHADAGKVTVEVGYRQDELVVDIGDEGPGIPSELAERVFEPFVRGQSDSPGVGLGLAISRTLARQMGGDLVLLPSDRGAHFRLTLRAQKAKEARPKSARQYQFEGRTILVVDDIATNRLVAANLLKATRARIEQAASGDAALARLAEGGIDIVLLDRMMP